MSSTKVQVQSRRNGLIVTMPRDVAVVANRFFTKGDNELIFEQTKTPEGRPKRIPRASGKPVVFSSENDSPSLA
ncbi:atp-dependent rna helicase [Lasius niger]|uniref:Atp-dependent rna helicase n=1 Tax=Lasius niger TaxID=67767 RepID=A0A0J7NY63_LASNI|nr:atp-dependent rna helicase [Lasius niger]